MVESILNSIKKLLNLPVSDEAFDQDILVHINSVFMTLNQLGIGPTNVYSISGPDNTWANFLGENISMYSAVKSYMYLKVRMVFDPPGTSYLITAYEKQILELEWRLTNQVPIPPEPVPPVDP